MEFKQMIQEFMEALQQRTIERVLSLITIDEDVNLILYNGARFHGRRQMLQLQAAWFSDPEWSLDFTILRTVETLEMAYAFILVNYADPNLSAQPYAKQHYLSLVFTRKDDTWVLIHDQATEAMEAAS
jgi:ketosteroid isomerase-like protein